MAELTLSTIGGAVGGAIGGPIGAAIGSTLGAVAGRAIDQRLFGEDRRIHGPRAAEIAIQGSSEGAGVPIGYGRVRLAGQVIWAARPREVSVTEDVGAGKGGGPTATRYAYTLSFAVGLCDGEVARIERAWANGAPLDLSSVAYRLHQGEETQEPDPLIEAIEGADAAPAYRGTSYVVFEDLPLDPFGGAPPNLSFEIVCRLPRAAPDGRLEDLATGVCLIPGAGEFALATTPVTRTIRRGEEASENQHAATDRADLDVSLDHLLQDLPNCRSVMLVVGWFADDLRCGECQIRPGVEAPTKTTRPLAWRVAGIGREGAHVISQIDGGPAYGGAPSDASVLEAIAALKARGLAVGLYPFVFMDVPPGSQKPDPYGGEEQAAFPWRGRITVHPAAGQPGSADKSAAAVAQIAAFFGAATPANITVVNGEIAHHGLADWSYRRFVLHYARLAESAGGVDAFVIGSELRGLTTARDEAGGYPAVAALRALAADVRAILGAATKLTYAADWSEYFGHQPNDGSGDVAFHLDPLWADPAIDAVGIDWYPPLADWREGGDHADAQTAAAIHDPGYLDAGVAGGEQFDWHYPDDAARESQQRAPIADGAYGEPWVFRPKDLVSWWSNPHHDRPGGVRSPAPTAWTPRSKPIWFVELGCPAIDKGANAPNLFVDPKSAESARPPFSRGTRDDLIQRRALEAHLRRLAPGGPLNPISPIYGAPMIDSNQAHLWAWDARPFPAFPARGDVWADAPAYQLGHWLNGRVGAPSLGDVVADLCRRAQLPAPDVAALDAAAPGLLLDTPTTPRAALAGALAALGVACVERDGRLVFSDRPAPPRAMITQADLAVDDRGGAQSLTRADPAEAVRLVRLAHLDPDRDHRRAVAVAERRDGAQSGVRDLDVGLALSGPSARAIAEAALERARSEAREVIVRLPPRFLALEPADAVMLDLPGAAGRHRVRRVVDSGAMTMHLTPDAAPPTPAVFAGAGADPAIAPPVDPALIALDLPPLPGEETDPRPLLAVYAKPWPGAVEVFAGPTLGAATPRARLAQPSCVGELVWPLYPGPVWRVDSGNRVRARFFAPPPLSVSREALLNGANRFAVEAAPGRWELLQAASVVQVGPEEYELSEFLRGLQGGEGDMGAPAPAGAVIVAIDRRLARLDLAAGERGAPIALAAVAAGRRPVARQETTAALGLAALRPFAPTAVSGVRRADGALALAWVRRSRLQGDDWTAAEIPLGEEQERYRVEVTRDGVLVVAAETAEPALLVPADIAAAAFPEPGAPVGVSVAQWSPVYGLGPRAESILRL